MRQIELHIIALADSASSEGDYVLVLEDQNEHWRLPIVMGRFEAQAIAVALEKIGSNRPLTHDLFKNTLDQSGVTISEVVISDLIDGIFYAKLIGKKADGAPLEVDARPSDAVALAIRFECPIFTSEDILKRTGVGLENSGKIFPGKPGQLSEYSLEELEQLLEQVLAKEDYESASRIRDAIKNKR